MIPPRLREFEIDSLADIALPLSMLLSTALVVVAIDGAIGPYVPAPPAVPLIALALGVEGYCFNTAFVVRHYDSAVAMRLLEGAVALVACKWIASIPYGAGPIDALIGVTTAGMWLWTLVLFAAWALGAATAFQLVPLHPAQLKLTRGQDHEKHNNHWLAFSTVRNRVLGELMGAALVAGVAGWARGDRPGVWGWSMPAFWLLVQASLTVASLVTANQLRQRVSWAQEGLEPPGAIFDRWMWVAGSLVLVPLLLALLLPVGPQIRLSGGSRPVEPPLMAPPTPIRNNLPPPDSWLTRLLEQTKDMPPLVPPWVWTALATLLYAGLAVLVLFLLNLALEQLRERASREELRGLKRLLLMLLEWYAALWQALWHAFGGVVGKALAGPAEVLHGVLGEAGVVGRYLPHRSRAPAEPRAAVRYFFARLQAEAARRSVRRAPGATAGEFARRLAAAAPERSQEVTELVELYNRARYSEEPVTREAAGFARRAWVAIARALRR